MAVTTYTVVKGDTLTAIAAKYNTTVANLVNINNITDPNYIVVGQVIKLTNDGSSSSSSTTSNKVVIKAFGLQSNTDGTLYVTWDFAQKDLTEKYKVEWTYTTGDGVLFLGTESEVTWRQATWSIPDNAETVQVRVKPISKTKKVGDKETTYFTGSWCDRKKYYTKNNPPSKPSQPTITIEDLKLTVEVTVSSDINAKEIQFQIVKDNSSVFKTGTSTIKTNYASYSCTVTAGHQYKVRCRAKRGNLYSDWTEYTSNTDTAPSAPSRITTYKATSESSVLLIWSEVTNADSYEIQYTTEKVANFAGSDEVQSKTSESARYELTGLESGKKYFFRIRAVNSEGKSPWTSIVWVVVGKKPAAPTTWSSTTTATTGKTVTLYWVHNSEDNSNEKYAEVELYIDGVRESKTIKNASYEDDEITTHSYQLDTSGYLEGAQIFWRVRTSGITNEYGDWSVQRTIDIYTPPSLEFNITDSNGDSIETLTTLPFYISALPSAGSQIPISYHVGVYSNEIYETVDFTGNPKIVNKGEAVYSNYFDITDSLLIECSANNIDLENGMSYTATCTVTMNSGLTAESSTTFSVSWTDEQYEPSAEIGFYEDTVTTHIRPYCIDADGNMIEGVTLAVYRREFDGTFTELIKGVDQTKHTYITDPHPALDYARYRIVATTESTGAVSYYDVPGYPIGEKSIIIQWDEEWTNFDTTSEDALEQPPWSGSLLRLPYNVDVSDNNKIDVSLVEYVGRKHPVTYYGTQVGQSATWNVTIEKDDKETLYALRRLAVWMGDVYVREPSGSGYWATISVSFNQKHCDMTIPVTLNITRVEGGA